MWDQRWLASGDYCKSFVEKCEGSEVAGVLTGRGEDCYYFFPQAVVAGVLVMVEEEEMDWSRV